MVERLLLHSPLLLCRTNAMIHGYDKTTGHPALADKKVLLIDRCQATREVRAAVLRTHGVEVRVTAYGLMG